MNRRHRAALADRDVTRRFSGRVRVFRVVCLSFCCSGLGACAAGEVPGERRAPTVAALTAPLSIAGDAGAPAAGADAGSAPDAEASRDCCTASGVAGCPDEAVEACVCAGDPSCCTVEYDGLCALQAVSRCGLDCDHRPPASDCCGPSEVPGCKDLEVEACICDIDPFCCVFRFDENCVRLGASRCQATCEGLAP